MVVLDLPVEGELKLRDLATQLLPRQLRHLLRRRVPRTERLEHRHTRNAEHVTRNTGEFDIRRFDELEQPIALCRTILDEFPAITEQVAQLTNRFGWDKALRNQAASQEFGDPLTVLHVGLPTRDILDVMSIPDHDFEIVLQHRVHWLPVHAGAFHSDDRAFLVAQPVAQSHQVAGHGGECPNSLVRLLARLTDEQARYDRRLMHIQSTTSFEDCLHVRLQGKRRSLRRGNFRHCHTSFPLPGTTKVGTSVRRGSVYCAGLEPPQCYRPRTIAISSRVHRLTRNPLLSSGRRVDFHPPLVGHRPMMATASERGGAEGELELPFPASGERATRSKHNGN